MSDSNELKPNTPPERRFRISSSSTASGATRGSLRRTSWLGCAMRCVGRPSARRWRSSPRRGAMYVRSSWRRDESCWCSRHRCKPHSAKRARDRIPRGCSTAAAIPMATSSRNSLRRSSRTTKPSRACSTTPARTWMRSRRTLARYRSRRSGNRRSCRLRPNFRACSQRKRSSLHRFRCRHRLHRLGRRPRTRHRCRRPRTRHRCRRHRTRHRCRRHRTRLDVDNSLAHVAVVPVPQ